MTTLRYTRLAKFLSDKSEVVRDFVELHEAYNPDTPDKGSQDSMPLMKQIFRQLSYQEQHALLEYYEDIGGTSKLYFNPIPLMRSKS